jgi:hypothetical protein
MDVYQRRRLVALSAIAVVFVLFVLLIRSCGGDDDEATPEPLAGATGAGGVTVLTQADYIAQADPICLEANTSFADVDESDPAGSDNEKSQIIAGELQQLQTLPPPDDGTDKLEKFLSSLQKLSEAYQDRSTAAERGDETTVADLNTTIDEEVTESEKVAGKFGFEVCGDLSKVGEADAGGGGGGDAETETTTDTGGTVTPTEPVVPTTTTPVPVAPPTDEGGVATPEPVTPAPTDGGGDSSSGGVSP